MLMHLNSIAMPDVVQIIMTFCTVPWVTKLIVCPTHLRNSIPNTLIYFSWIKVMDLRFPIWEPAPGNAGPSRVRIQESNVNLVDQTQFG